MAKQGILTLKVGLPIELMHLEWMPELKQTISRMVRGIEWHHVPTTRETRLLVSDGDACYPFKKMIRTSLALISDVDVLLLPRITSLDRFLMCPNFRALPDIVAINIKNSKKTHNIPIAMPLMELSHEKQLDRMAALAVQQLLGHFENRRKNDQINGYRPVPEPSSSLPSIDHGSQTVALIGHPYVINDPTLNNRVPEILRTRGFETISAQQIPFRELDRLAKLFDYYAKKLYWRPAREGLGAFLYFTRIRPPAGIIHLIPFNCGVDALLRIELESLHNRMNNPPPYMVIVCDEHTQPDHVVTRVEAFLDMVHDITI